MSYLKTWHRDYAAEAIKRGELNRSNRDPNYDFARYVVTCGQGAQLAQKTALEIGNETLAGIAQTVIDTINDVARGGTPRTRSRRKITSDQQHALSVLLLEKYGTARAIGAAIWGLVDAEIENADV